jgi:hypothetical protein
MPSEKFHLKPIKPVKMWAIARMGIRSPWILPNTVRKTRTETIDAFVFDGLWASWEKAYSLGFRVIRVTVLTGWS